MRHNSNIKKEGSRHSSVIVSHVEDHRIIMMTIIMTIRMMGRKRIRIKEKIRK